MRSGQGEPRGPDDEAEWTGCARLGDGEAFRRLVERHQDRVYGLAYRVIGSAPEAEEAAQDAFVRAWRALPEFRGEARFSTWLYRIALRCAYDASARLRARRAREESFDAMLDTPGREAALAAASAPDPRGGGLPAHLLERLSEVQRAVVTLYYLEDRSVEEVARVMDLPGNTVKTHLHRARAALRDALRRGERRTSPEVIA